MRGIAICLGVLCALSTIAQADVTTIFASVGPKAAVPGSSLTFGSFDRPVSSPNGQYWMMLARNTSGTSSDAMFISGKGTAGTLEWQEGVDVIETGRTATTSDRYVSINDSGEWVGLVNLNSGATTDDEIVLRGSAGGSKAYTIPAREGQATGAGLPGEKLGRFNYSPNISSAGNVSYGYVIDGFASSADLHYFGNNGNTLFTNEGGTGPSGQVGGGSANWSSFSTNSLQVTGNENHWLIRGKLSDGSDVIAVDNQVVVQDGMNIGGIGVVDFLTGDQNMLTENGDAYIRGRVDTGAGFAARNDTILATDGDLIPGSATEHWDGSAWTSSSGSTFFINVGNNNGDYVIGGFTDNPDTTRNAVWVFNNEVILRSGDQIDLDGDGNLDDAFIYFSSFTTAAPKSLGGFLTDDNIFYFTADVRNGAGSDLGEGFFSIAVPEPGAITLLSIGLMAWLRRRQG